MKKKTKIIDKFVKLKTMENKNLYSEEEIDDYVLKALEKQKSEIIKEIEKEKIYDEEEFESKIGMDYDFLDTYNQVIDQILEVLNKK